MEDEFDTFFDLDTLNSFKGEAEPEVLRAVRRVRRNTKEKTSQLDLFSEKFFKPQEPSHATTELPGRISEPEIERDDGTQNLEALAGIRTQTGGSAIDEGHPRANAHSEGRGPPTDADSAREERETEPGARGTGSLGSSDEAGVGGPGSEPGRNGDDLNFAPSAGELAKPSRDYRITVRAVRHRGKTTSEPDLFSQNFLPPQEPAHVAEEQAGLDADSEGVHAAGDADVSAENREVEPATSLNGSVQSSEEAEAEEPRQKSAHLGFAFAGDEPARPSRDYQITEDSLVGEGSLREKAGLNIEAIRLLKSIEAASREATDEEKNLLARYSGWGALPAAFDIYTGREDEWNRTRDDLKALLTEDEYNAARSSVPNAHYTSPLVVQAIWSALERMGVGAGARILEPSVGTGNFLGLMPESLMPGASRTGVELDSITARIAKLLYPDSVILGSGFEDAPFPNHFFDVAIGNVPFGKYGVHDANYKPYQTSSIHDYFFVKSLDKLRPGGVLALITSRYTMDKEESRIREHLASQADLLGAIRLPNRAFEDNAGTIVTTDIIFLQKRANGQKPNGATWQKVADYAGLEYNSFAINEYYIQKPAMMLGTMKLIHSRYGTQPELVGEITPENLQAAIESLPRDIYAPRADIAPATPYPLSGDESALIGVRNGAFVIVRDVLGIQQDGEFTPSALKVKAEARVRGMMKVRDYVRAVFQTQLADNTDAIISEARRNLNHAYDRFVAEFGCLSSMDNRRAFSGDPDAPLLLSLEENYDEARGRAKKAAIFERRTLDRYRPVEHVETAAEALAVSLNEYGRIDWHRMACVTGRTPVALRHELGPLVYENPETATWETADEYLSGNVRQKLASARAAATIDKKYGRNIAPLEGVQPTDLLSNEITARLGSTWIPTDDIGDFVADLIDAAPTLVRVDYLAELATWVVTAKEWVKGNVANTTTYGTERFTAINLIEEALNGRVPTAYDTIPGPEGEKRVINEPQTLAAREAQQKLKDKFAEWIWQDPDRATRLAEIYNEKFNSLRLRTYDGSHLTFPGMNKAILRNGELDPHQKNAVWRILQGDSTLLAHCVGAGKTWIMTAAAMEARRIGLTKKSMIVVPNHLVEQWGQAFLQLYPQANIFVAGKEHFQAGKRERAMSRIATGNFDAVIVSHKSFELLPVSDRLFDAYMQEELDALQKTILEASADKGNRRIVKILEAGKKRLAKRIEDRAKREKKDKTITFEELGVDRVFVDEADLYKNLGFTSKMTRIAGLPNSDSNRAADMHIKTRYLRKQSNGKGVVFATGTPISNTMAELYTMQRYLAPEALQAAGMAPFDAWAANFGEAVTSLELAPSGAGYRMHTRFAKFVNLPELLTMFRDFADVQTADMLNLPRPALEGGKNKIITAPCTPELKEYVNGLTERADKIRGGMIDPRVDNMLKITSDGRKAALDMRLVNPFASMHAATKVNLVINEVFAIWKETEARRATQLAFCDLSTPNPDRFHVYGAIRSGLIERGIPPSEIAFIHDADTDAAKKRCLRR